MTSHDTTLAPPSPQYIKEDASTREAFREKVSMVSLSRRDHSAGLATAILMVTLASCVLARTASGSCLKFGHSCWGGHGKRSGDMAPRGPPPEASSEDLNWPSEDDWPHVEAAWHKLRRITHPRRPTAPPPLDSGSTDTDDSSMQRDESPPPRWLYHLMRQAAAASKLD